LLIAYIAQVAHWFALPGWAQIGVRLESPWAVAGIYVAMVAAAWPIGAWLRRRRGLAPRPGGDGARRGRVLALGATAVAAVLLVVPAPPWSGRAQSDDLPAAGLEVTILDVGQGDSILLQPPDGAPVLVDTGPPDADLGAKLDDERVTRLAALAITHDQLDHAGGAADALGSVDTSAFLYAEARRRLLGTADAAGTRTTRVSAGRTIRSGSLRLDVLWPPAELLEAHPTADERNRLSLVMLARWHGFSILLTGDAEAEEVPIDPGPVDVLKVAHHGSEDAGLERLVERTSPRLAVISVGDNSYGHPTPETLATLQEHHVPVLRTDLDGDVEINVGEDGWSAAGD
jgi:competence protein ComEC